MSLNKPSTAVLGLGLLLTTGCPAPRPVLPELPPGGDGTGDGSTTLDGGSTSLGATSLDSSSSSAGESDTTSLDATNGSEGSTTGGEPACGLLRGGACEQARTAWWNTEWAYRQRIDVESPLMGVLVDAVVPVRLDDAFDYDCARADAADVRFVDGDGLLMAHEIDEWRPGARSVAWVRVPALETTGTSFWIYYGNPSADANPAEVWTQDLGYLAVLHFGGDLDDARGVHHGEPAGAQGPLYVDEGVVGQAVHYEKILVDARAELMGSDEIDDAIIADQAFTLTAWIRSTPDVASPTPYRAVMSRGSDYWSLLVDDLTNYDFLPPSYALFFSRCQTPECIALLEIDDYGNHFLRSTVPVIEHPVIAVWHHVAITYEAVGGGQYAKRLYVDGELDADFTGPLPLSWNTMMLHADPVTIGAGPQDSEEAVFHGEIDEIRLASQAWDAARIQAEHAFTEQAGLVTVGAVECR